MVIGRVNLSTYVLCFFRADDFIQRCKRDMAVASCKYNELFQKLLAKHLRENRYQNIIFLMTRLSPQNESKFIFDI